MEPHAWGSISAFLINVIFSSGLFQVTLQQAMAIRV